MSDPDRSAPLLPIRTTLIFLLATLTAVGAFTLVLLGRHQVAEAALVGLGSMAAAVKFFHWLIA